MHNKTEQHMEICKELNELHKMKNADYRDSFGETFQEFGITMAAIRLDDKLRRFKSLIKTESQVKDESIEDTLKDLANYSIMTLIEIRQQK